MRVSPLHHIALLIALALLAGCSVNNIQQGMYEGFRVRSDLQGTPSERVGKNESPTYQDYERMKKERLEHETGR